jgi:hypothetical protein
MDNEQNAGTAVASTGLLALDHGPCVNCGKDTTEGRVWCDAIEGDLDMPGMDAHWAFAHDKCTALFLMRLESNPRLRMSDGTPVFRKAVDRILERIRSSANNSITGGGTPSRECTGSQEDQR